MDVQTIDQAYAQLQASTASSALGSQSVMRIRGELRALGVVLALLTLAGCTIPTYHRPDTTQAQLDQDFRACIRDAGTVPDPAWISAQVQTRDECMESKGYTREGQPDQGGVIAPLGWIYIPLISDYVWSVVKGAALQCSRSAPAPGGLACSS